MIKAIRNYFLECEFLAPGAMLGIDYLGDKKISYSINIDPTNPVIKRYADGGSIRSINFSFLTREYYSASSLENSDNLKFFEKLTDWIKENNKKEVLPKITGGNPIEIDILTNGYLMDATSEDGQYMIQLKLIYEEDY